MASDLSPARWIGFPFMDIARIRPDAPGFELCEIRPQLGDLGALKLTAYSVRGPIRLEAEPIAGGHHIEVTLPPGCDGELVLPPGSEGRLVKLTRGGNNG